MAVWPLAFVPLAFLWLASRAQLGPDGDDRTDVGGLLYAAGLLTYVTCGVLLFVQRDAALGIRSPETISWTLYKRPGYILSGQIANYIRSTTHEEDTIYVAFAQADLYYLSARRGAAPQYYYLLVTTTR